MTYDNKPPKKQGAATADEKFNLAVNRNILAMAAAGVPQNAKFKAAAERFGAAKAVHDALARRQALPGFIHLTKTGMLNLSLEALVVNPVYSAIFSDEEVDFCFAALVEAGYYET